MTAPNSTMGSVDAKIPFFPINAELVTPSDSTTFGTPRAVAVFGAGTLVTTPWGEGADITITVTSAMVANVPFIPPWMVQKVKAATTATTIVSVW